MLSWSRRDWPAAYFDGRSAGRAEVTLRFTDEGVRISGLPSGDVFWYHFELRLAEATAPGDPVRLERSTGTGEALVIADPSAREPLAIALAGHAGTDAPRAPWSLAKQLTTLLAVTVGFVASLYVWVIPWLATRAAARVPLAWEEGMGEALLRSVTSAERTCQEPARIAALDRMVATLTAQGRGDRYTFHVTVIDDSLVNAMAAPGGQIVFFRGLLEAAESPEELAGVLAHELQHVVLRHGTAGILRQIPLRLFAAAVTGGGGIGDHAIGAAATLGHLGYARGDEEAADREGIRMLQAAQVGTDGMVSFMGRLATLNGGDADPGLAAYLSTHPASAARAQALAELAAAARYAPVRLLTDAEWAAVRAPCAREGASRSTGGSAAPR